MGVPVLWSQGTTYDILSRITLRWPSGSLRPGYGARVCYSIPPGGGVFTVDAAGSEPSDAQPIRNGTGEEIGVRSRETNARRVFRTSAALPLTSELQIKGISFIILNSATIPHLARFVKPFFYGSRNYAAEGRLGDLGRLGGDMVAENGWQAHEITFTSGQGRIHFPPLSVNALFFAMISSAKFQEKSTA